MQRSYLDPPVPIAALATAPGESALAVIRTSGPGSIELAAACFSRPRALSRAPGHTLVAGSIVDPGTGEAIDEVLASVFRAPRSATGEDGVEFSCHGSPAVVRRALDALEKAGFSRALPGEFSCRAFLHGKTDLVRAEAVAELVRARSEAARGEALKRLEGGLSKRLAAIRARVLAVLAEAEVRLDFDEEEGAPAEAAIGGLDAARAEVAALADSYATARLYDEGALVVVAGRPNAGKSTLFNLALREERSIVSPEPGTTRDWIEARVEIEGLPLRLADTAGLREAGSGVEGQGVARSRRLLAAADVVAYLVDGGTGLAPEDEATLSSLAGRPVLRVWNKVDDPACGPPPDGFLPLSAARGDGFAAFAAAVAAAARARLDAGGTSSGAGEAEARIASARQKALLDRTLEALDAAAAGLDAGVHLDALALDLREAADALGEITGEISGEDVLEAVFSGFCVGK